jgi:hypothetical protein
MVSWDAGIIILIGTRAAKMLNVLGQLSSYKGRLFVHETGIMMVLVIPTVQDTSYPAVDAE